LTITGTHLSCTSKKDRKGGGGRRGGSLDVTTVSQIPPRRRRNLRSLRLEGKRRMWGRGKKRYMIKCEERAQPGGKKRGNFYRLGSKGGGVMREEF